MKSWRILLTFVITWTISWGVFAQQPHNLTISNNDIVFLYDNDVHCAIDGYGKIAALREEVKQQTSHILLLSSGDFVSGKSMGSVSKGEYIIRLMNAVGYDYVTLGNHEFDFGMAQMRHLMQELTAKVLCCNFGEVATGKPMFEEREVRTIGGKKIGIVGVATPSSISTGTPSNFMTESGELLYTFGLEKIYQIVQQQVDACRSEGADVVIVLSHLGIDPPGITSYDLIHNTKGIDVVLDGHSHSVIEQQMEKNMEGKMVILTSTGTEFTHVGVVTLSASGELHTQLVPTKEITGTVSDVQAEIGKIKEEYAAIGNRKLGTSKVTLSINGEDGRRMVRRVECTIGDFVADAFRVVMNTDIGWTNGGGCRSTIEAGEITFNSIYSALPFESKVCVADVTGQDVLDALEMAAHATPKEYGGFAQISGLRFEIDTTITTSVVQDENNTFVRVAGERRVSHVYVYNHETGKYKKLSPKRHYTIASTNFILKKGGDGIRFPHLQILQDEVALDTEVVEKYLQQTLNGCIDERYALPDGRVRMVAKKRKQ